MAKFRSIEYFCKAICWLIFGGYIIQLDYGILDVLADEMVLNIDIFRSSMMLRIPGELDCWLAIRIQRGLLVLAGYIQLLIQVL